MQFSPDVPQLSHPSVEASKQLHQQDIKTSLILLHPIPVATHRSTCSGSAFPPHKLRNMGFSPSFFWSHWHFFLFVSSYPSKFQLGAHFRSNPGNHIVLCSPSHGTKSHENIPVLYCSGTVAF
jgi:hypothetical protein